MDQRLILSSCLAHASGVSFRGLIDGTLRSRAIVDERSGWVGVKWVAHGT